MALAALFWIVPNDVRSRKVLPTPEAEQTFDLLWLAFERWMAQGLTHYAQVAVELAKFYSQLRWGLAAQQASQTSSENFEDVISQQAEFYLTQVRDIVRGSYTDFEKEIDILTTKLSDIRETRRSSSAGLPSRPVDEADQKKKDDTGLSPRTLQLTIRGMNPIVRKAAKLGAVAPPQKKKDDTG